MPSAPRRHAVILGVAALLSAVSFAAAVVAQPPAESAAEAARNVGGVLKVVKVFEIVPESALSSTTTVPAPVQSTAPAAGSATTTP